VIERGGCGGVHPVVAAANAAAVAEYLTRMDFIVLDELGYLPFARTGGRDNYACRLSHAPPRAMAQYMIS
jgi:hypothetical protein